MKQVKTTQHFLAVEANLTLFQQRILTEQKYFRGEVTDKGLIHSNMYKQITIISISTSESPNITGGEQRLRRDRKESAVIKK